MTPLEFAQAGVLLIEHAILEHLKDYPSGRGNSAIARSLGLTLNQKSLKDSISWSVLISLEKENKVHRVGRKKLWAVNPPAAIQDKLPESN